MHACYETNKNYHNYCEIVISCECFMTGFERIM